MFSSNFVNMAVVSGLLFLSTSMVTAEATRTADPLSVKLISLEAHVISAEQKSAVLEAKQQALEQELSELRTLNASFQQSLGHLTTEIQREAEDLKTLVRSVQNQNKALAYDLDVLRGQVVNGSRGQGAGGPHISFHVRMSSRDNTSPSSGTPLVLTDVRNNEGRGYSTATGKFTAPTAGVYCLLGSTEPMRNHYAGVYLVVDGQSVDYAESTSPASSHESVFLHAVVKLSAGQKVWLKSNYGSKFWYSPTTFSGFLVTAE